MNFLRQLLIITIICLVQFAFLPYFTLFQIKPDLLFVIVIIASVYSGWRSALILAIALGLLKDIFSAQGIGVNLSVYCLWAVIVNSLSRKINLQEDMVLSAFVFITIFCNNFFLRPIFFHVNFSLSPGIFLRTGFVEAAYSSFFTLFLLYIFRRFKILGVE